MIEFRPFKAEDIKFLSSNAVDDSVIDWRIATDYANYGPAYTGYHNGNIIGAAGLIFRRRGVCNIWSIFSKDILTCKKTTFRSFKLMLEMVIRTFEITKIRSESRIGFKASQSLLEHLGFKRQRRNMINGKYYFYMRRM